MKLSILAIFCLSSFLWTVLAAPFPTTGDSDAADVGSGKIQPEMQPPVAKKENQPPAAKKKVPPPSSKKAGLDIQPPVAKKQATDAADAAAVAVDDEVGQANAAGLGYGGGLEHGYDLGYGLGYGKKFGGFGGNGKKKFGDGGWGGGINVKNVEIENKDFGDDFGRDWY
ncbi:hypothetical protein DFJ73DRAFT_8163 [Zopfochytrium polystomum]|nr:hypothetical protein DFJ73DRAFT_8163 [Zopfochytrium polystomum]